MKLDCRDREEYVGEKALVATSRHVFEGIGKVNEIFSDSCTQ